MNELNNVAIEMTNVKHEVKSVKGKSQLVITVDLEPSKGTGLSLTSKGRSYQVATSNGFQKLSGDFADLAFSMNVIMDKKAYEAQVARLTAPATPVATATATPASDEVASLKELVAAQQAQMAQMQQMMMQFMQTVASK